MGVSLVSGGIVFSPATDDQVLLPIDDIDKPFFIHASQVACMKPPFLENLSRGLLIFIETFHNIWAPADQLADLALRDLPVLIIHHPHFQEGKGRANAGVLSKGVLCFEDRNIGRGLCTAIDIITSV